MAGPLNLMCGCTYVCNNFVGDVLLEEGRAWACARMTRLEDSNVYCDFL